MQIHDKVSRSIRDSGWFPKSVPPYREQGEGVFTKPYPRTRDAAEAKRQKPYWISTTVTLPSGSGRLRRKESPKDRPKRKVSETGSGSYSQRANSKEHERSPKTENDNFDTEHDTAGQNPCLAGFHISLKFLFNFIRNPSCQFIPNRRDCCKCTYHTYINLFRSFLLTVNSYSDYAGSAHKEKCDPKCYMAVVAGLRRICIVIYHCFRINGKCCGCCAAL